MIFIIGHSKIVECVCVRVPYQVKGPADMASVNHMSVLLSHLTSPGKYGSLPAKCIPIAFQTDCHSVERYPLAHLSNSPTCVAISTTFNNLVSMSLKVVNNIEARA